METGKIGVTTENIFPIIKKFLYSDHEIFLRELVSNAVDATTKLKVLSSLGDFKGELGDLTVNVKLDEAERTLTISDSGIGMTRQEVEKYINQIAFSGAEEFMEKHKLDAQNIIGHFGLGFFSAFMVADRVQIITKSHVEGSVAVRWECDGSPEYVIQDSERAERGTDVILHFADDSVEFNAKSRIETLLKKYCSFLPVPIAFGKKREWSADEKKYIDTDSANIINDTTPLWKLSPKDITAQQYTEFYHKLYPMAEDPLFHIHLNVDYPFNLTGILYFPKLKNNIEVQKNKIQLYCNQVFVTDSVEGIVPEFLTLLGGVIDSPDIPLNVSRSYLQSDSNVKKISTYITKKVADRLAELFKNEREQYEKKWDDLKIFIQYGVISDEKFGDRASEYTLLKNTEGKYFTLEEYSNFVGANQTDKEKKVVHIYSNDPIAQHGFIQGARDKGYDVLVMDSPLESHFISFLENKHPDWTFKRVDADVVEKLIEHDEQPAMALTIEQQQTLTPVFEAVLPQGKDVNYKVEFAPMSSDAVPVVITQNEFMRRMRDMSKMGGGMSFYGEMPESYNVVINGNNQIVADILSEVESKISGELSEDQRKSALQEAGQQSAKVHQLIDLALLGGGLLRGEALTKFIQRSVELI